MSDADTGISKTEGDKNDLSITTTLIAKPITESFAGSFTSIVERSDDVKIEVEIDCPRCGQRGIADHRNKHICVSCAKTENSLYSHRRMHRDWVAIAAESGIELWVQQPEETQWEYTVWVAYRDSYPGKKPSYKSVAEQLSTTVNAVMKIAQRWSFQMRMQAWMRHCDDITLLQRRTEILGMNQAHINMASRIREKLVDAIELIKPAALEPKDITSLFKLSAELERKARVDTIAQDEMVRALTTDNDNPALKKTQTPQSDMKEVLQILMQTGALGQITHVGMKETKEIKTTTETKEIELVDNNGRTTSIQLNREAT